MARSIVRSAAYRMRARRIRQDDHVCSLLDVEIHSNLVRKTRYSPVETAPEHVEGVQSAEAEAEASVGVQGRLVHILDEDRVFVGCENLYRKILRLRKREGGRSCMLACVFESACSTSPESRVD